MNWLTSWKRQCRTIIPCLVSPYGNLDRIRNHHSGRIDRPRLSRTGQPIPSGRQGPSPMSSLVSGVGVPYGWAIIVTVRAFRPYDRRASAGRAAPVVISVDHNAARETHRQHNKQDERYDCLHNQRSLLRSTSVLVFSYQVTGWPASEASDVCLSIKVRPQQEGE